METNRPILRGIDRDYYEGSQQCRVPDICTIVPKHRVSKTTNNIYTALISGFFDDWVVYPKRNNSFICTFSRTIAGYYTGSKDGIYLIFPKNGANIGICPEDDIWVSFKFASSILGFGGLSDFNDKMDYMFRVLVKIPDMNELKKAFAYVDKNKIIEYFDLLANTLSQLDEETYKAVPMIECLHNEAPKVGRELIKILNYCFDPDKNGFVNCDISDLYIYYRDGAQNELWTDSECLYINMDNPLCKKIFPNLIIGDKRHE